MNTRLEASARGVIRAGVEAALACPRCHHDFLDLTCIDCGYRLGKRDGVLKPVGDDKPKHRFENYSFDTACRSMSAPSWSNTNTICASSRTGRA